MGLESNYNRVGGHARMQVMYMTSTVQGNLTFNKLRNASLYTLSTAVSEEPYSGYL